MNMISRKTRNEIWIPPVVVFATYVEENYLKLIQPIIDKAKDLPIGDTLPMIENFGKVINYRALLNACKWDDSGRKDLANCYKDALKFMEIKPEERN
ncbi:MAG: hypothetical protein Kapaf2KO_22670 [Candidatus Kapaibacteriales bacterium]